jgi:dTDP-4-dehydrorhamnose 3,5-epimerase
MLLHHGVRLAAFMQFETGDIQGLVILTPRRFGDDRGWFTESWSARRMAEAGFEFDFCQDNHSLSRDPGTLRGLHFQRPPFAQTKLVRCTAGRIFDVAVDARVDSPTYGQWQGVALSARNGRQLLVPRGCLHGFLTLEPKTEVQYKVDAPYAAYAEGEIAWDDPDLGIDWPLAVVGVDAPSLSAKDATATRFADFISPFEYLPDAGTPA